MVSSLVSLMAVAASLAGGRHASLDSLASNLLEMDHIPSGAALLHQASASGWVWPLQSVSIHGSFPGFPPDSMAWGLSESSLGVCVVTAAPPTIIFDPPLPHRITPGDSISLVPDNGPYGLRGAATTPSLEVILLEPGIMVLDQVGTWWLELMADTEYGPQVIVLVPVIAGAPGGWPGNRWQRGEILQGVNALRRKFSLPPLESSRFLNLLAGIRARQARNWGGAFHSFPGSPDTREAMPEAYGAWAENIAAASDLGEAAEMILLSPFHFATFMDARYGFMGLGSVTSRKGVTLVLLLTEANPEESR